ncbi:MAG: hypothetical protein JST20_10855 [Bacteroidetes bacterium]|nr:hypothetical protein [Bacteroidota bacterium]
MSVYKHLFSTDDLLTKFDLGNRLSTKEWEGMLKEPYIEIGPIKVVPPEKGDTDECGNNE